MKQQVLRWMMVAGLLEVLSVSFIFDPAANSAAALAIGVAMFIVTLWRPAIALSFLSMEFLIGSKGRLLAYGADGQNNGGISLRIILFAAFVGGWLVATLIRRLWREWPRLLRDKKVYVAVALLVVYGLVLGWLAGNPALFADANAWGAFLLLLPILGVAACYPEAVRRQVYPAVLAALFWLPIKTLLVFFLFSHEIGYAAGPVYLWIRRTGVGEITPPDEFIGPSRVFFQSHVYALFVIVGFFVWRAFERMKKTPAWLWLLLMLSAAEILISLSRSFWIGLACGLLVAFFTLVRRAGWIQTRRAALATATAGVLGLGLMAAVFYWPLPNKEPGAFSSLFLGRVDVAESAATSRWELARLLWRKIAAAPHQGHGFGATVTYESADPRVVEKTEGIQTTYAFEWGWLDFWVKFGILGIPVILLFLVDLGRRAWRSGLPVWVRVSVVSSIVTLAVVHVFSPYLNHPLGIFALLVVEGLMVLRQPVAQSR